MPRKNKVFVDQGEIHLLGRDQDGWLHRQIDVEGTVVRQRSIASKRLFFREVLKLSFEEDSYLLAEEEGGRLVVERIDAAGQSHTSELYRFGAPLYNTWRPVKVAKDTFVTHFNAEYGNGWFTTRRGELLELFYNKGESGYRNLLTDTVLDTGPHKLVVSSVNPTKQNAYAVVFYSPDSKSNRHKTILVLNRSLD